ncbi:hypothetical protein J4430_01145 [Candidatus Woesearchaeota archaeon]|nr:hypothetical protein [Candidatus Woesearchaeota archaeon]
MSKDRKKSNQDKVVLKEIKAGTESVRKEEGKIRALEKKLSIQSKQIIEEEKHIVEEEKKIKKLEKRIIKEESKILSVLKRFKLGKKHLFDFIKIVAGALLGTSFGAGLLSKKELATNLPWINVAGIFVLAFVIAGLLVYKAERKSVTKGKGIILYVIKRVIYIWIIATAISTLASFLFLTETLPTEVLIKSLLIGSYPAVAGAIGFNFL